MQRLLPVAPIALTDLFRSICDVRSSHLVPRHRSFVRLFGVLKLTPPRAQFRSAAEMRYDFSCQQRQTTLPQALVALSIGGTAQ